MASANVSIANKVRDAIAAVAFDRQAPRFVVSAEGDRFGCLDRSRGPGAHSGSGLRKNRVPLLYGKRNRALRRTRPHESSGCQNRRSNAGSGTARGQRPRVHLEVSRPVSVEPGSAVGIQAAPQSPVG